MLHSGSSTELVIHLFPYKLQSRLCKRTYFYPERTVIALIEIGGLQGTLQQPTLFASRLVDLVLFAFALKPLSQPVIAQGVLAENGHALCAEKRLVHFAKQ